jgi:hypothetical protein
LVTVAAAMSTLVYNRRQRFVLKDPVARFHHLTDILRGPAASVPALAAAAAARPWCAVREGGGEKGCWCRR